MKETQYNWIQYIQLYYDCALYKFKFEYNLVFIITTLSGDIYYKLLKLWYYNKWNRGVIKI